jgi:membrane-bound serine protease (ClpP class)
VWAAVRARRLVFSPGLVGSGLPLGAAGVVRRPLAPEGSVYAAGEEWSARASDDRTIDRGTPVRIVGFDGLTVLVSPDPDAATIPFDSATAGRVESSP